MYVCMCALRKLITFGYNAHCDCHIPTSYTCSFFLIYRVYVWECRYIRIQPYSICWLVVCVCVCDVNCMWNTYLACKMTSGKWQKRVIKTFKLFGVLTSAALYQESFGWWPQKTPHLGFWGLFYKKAGTSLDPIFKNFK